MFIQTGCISGWQSIDIPVTTCAMQGIALTLRNSTVSSIKHDTPKSRKDAQLASSGDAVRSSGTYSANSITQLLLAASVNAYDNGPVLTSQYQVPIAFTNWANRGSVSSIGLRLGVATNETPSITVPNQVDFQQNFNGEDSLTMITRYYSASGNITVVGSGTKILAEDVSQITLPLHGSTAEGDTVILVVMSELDLAIPSGFNWDYTDKIKGVLPNLNELQRNTQLSVFRKVVTLEDVFDGSFIVNTVNSLALLPSLVTPTNFTAAVNYGTGINLTWDDNSTFEDGYRVYRDTSPITGILPSVYETLPPNSISYTDTGVVDDITYHYALGVYRDASEVLASPNVSTTYTGGILPPSASTLDVNPTLNAYSVQEVALAVDFSGGGSLLFFSGSRPAPGVSTGAPLITFMFSNPAFSTSLDTATANPIADSTLASNGSPTWFRAIDGAGNWVFDGSVGDDISLSITSTTAGAVASISNFVIEFSSETAAPSVLTMPSFNGTYTDNWTMDCGSSPWYVGVLSDPLTIRCQYETYSSLDPSGSSSWSSGYMTNNLGGGSGQTFLGGDSSGYGLYTQAYTPDQRWNNSVGTPLSSSFSPTSSPITLAWRWTPGPDTLEYSNDGLNWYVFRAGIPAIAYAAIALRQSGVISINAGQSANSLPVTSGYHFGIPSSVTTSYSSSGNGSVF